MKTLGACFLITCSAVACGQGSPTMPSVVSCSTAALRGTYGSQRNGQAAPGTVLTSVGVAAFDGAGHIVEHTTVSTNGSFSTITGQASSYAIGSDCTGIQTDASGTQVARLTMVHGGDEVLGISIVPGSNLAMHFERITSGCTNATLNGDYGFQRNGQTNGVSLLALGTITFHGNGHADAQQTSQRNGVVGPVQTFPDYMYAVNPDCTGAQIDPTGSVFSQFVVVHQADEILGMSMTPGNNVVIHFERTR
jgi:hypothetical protein